jgi:tetratricopeptide (TPR) repeat protein
VSAYTQFQKAAQTPHLRSRALYNAGNAAFDNADYPLAVQAYEAALALAPLDEDAWHNLEIARRKLSGPPTAEGGEPSPQPSHPVLAGNTPARSLLSAAQLRAQRELHFLPPRPAPGPGATRQADLFSMSPEQIVEFLREETRANYPFRPSSSIRRGAPAQSDRVDW